MCLPEPQAPHILHPPHSSPRYRTYGARDYIESVTAGTPILKQYIHQSGNALVRLECDLTPDEAAEYETVLLPLAE